MYTCRSLSNTLSAKPDPVCWRKARRRIHLPNPPLPAARGNWAEASYAHFIFGASYCINNCGTVCRGLPANYAMRFRVCSANCKHKLKSPENPISFAHWTAVTAGQDIAAMDLHEWLPDVFSDQACLYFPDSILAADEEYSQACLLQGRGEENVEYPFKVRTEEELSREWERRRASQPVLLQDIAI
ncbi:hypothetical protein C8R44DRAFT_347768 [Mycena epipterygia]|nr:hypothetical protein C8R44DRAFT_347768 [Mycena epipterygia]